MCMQQWWRLNVSLLWIRGLIAMLMLLIWRVLLLLLLLLGILW